LGHQKKIKALRAGLAGDCEYHFFIRSTLLHILPE
jgi:hypothetical protein